MGHQLLKICFVEKGGYEVSDCMSMNKSHQKAVDTMPMNSIIGHRECPKKSIISLFVIILAKLVMEMTLSRKTVDI